MTLKVWRAKGYISTGKLANRANVVTGYGFHTDSARIAVADALARRHGFDDRTGLLLAKNDVGYIGKTAQLEQAEIIELPDEVLASLFKIVKCDLVLYPLADADLIGAPTADTTTYATGPNGQTEATKAAYKEVVEALNYRPGYKLAQRISTLKSQYQCFANTRTLSRHQIAQLPAEVFAKLGLPSLSSLIQTPAASATELD